MACFSCQCIGSLQTGFENCVTSVEHAVQGTVSAFKNAPEYWEDQVKKAPSYCGEQVKKASAFWWEQMLAAPQYWTKQAAALASTCLMAANKAAGVDVPALQNRITELENEGGRAELATRVDALVAENAGLKAQLTALSQKKAHHHPQNGLEIKPEGGQSPASSSSSEAPSS
jgi:hypothetical protein